MDSAGSISLGGFWWLLVTAVGGIDGDSGREDDAIVHGGLAAEVFPVEIIRDSRDQRAEFRYTEQSSIGSAGLSDGVI